MANSSDDFSQVISEEVTCPVCLEELREPKILLCAHNICRECLERMYLRNKNVRDIVCPVCRKPTRIPLGGVENLQTNAVLVRVIEATLARKAKIEMKKSLEEGKPMVELLAKKISNFDKALAVFNDIHRKADKLVDVIRNQEASLCQEVEQLYGIKGETINVEKRDLDKLHSSASRSVQDAETILELSLSDPTKTINVAKALKEQIEKIYTLDLSDTSTYDNLEFQINAEANINSIFEGQMFGKLTEKVLNTGFTSSYDLPFQPPACTPPRQSASNTYKPDPLAHDAFTGENHCEFCGMAANLICRPCLRTVCNTCKLYYKQDLCPPTKREHQFENINEQSTYTTTNETESRDSSSLWSCERCTFLNSPTHRICAVCATSRSE